MNCAVFECSDNRWRSRARYLIIETSNFRTRYNSIIAIQWIAVDAVANTANGIRSRAKRYIESGIVVAAMAALIRIMMIIRAEAIRGCFCWSHKHVWR